MTEPSDEPLNRLDRFRPYLELLAKVQFDSRLRAKLDASDIVQQTLVQAVQAFGGFRGKSDAELAAWLRQILAHQIANTVRDYGREKRDIGREQAIFIGLEDSAQRLAGVLAAEQTSPSGQAIREEESLRLAEAVMHLPDAQREAITLHHLSGWTLDEVSTQLGRTPAAVAGLIKRGLQTLRKTFLEPN